MFSGRNQLIDRLTYQMGSRRAAVTVLKQRGHLDQDENLTPEGARRDNMTAEERSKDRNPNPSYLLSYSANTNRARLIRPNLKARKL